LIARCLKTERNPEGVGDLPMPPTSMVTEAIALVVAELWPLKVVE